MASDEAMAEGELERERRVGLCSRCRHARLVRARRAEYWLCTLSRTDPRFPKYPRLPVIACGGHEPGTPEGEF